MRETPQYLMTDAADIRSLIAANPWATMVSATDDGLVASHYPFLLEDDGDGLVLVSHVGRPDERAHRLGESELLVIFEGPDGYVSPGWYEAGPAVPTWNFAVVHAYGTPKLLSDDENLAVLDRLVDHFEAPLPEPFSMRVDAANSAYAERIVRGTVGFRMRVDRVVAKEKMSQGKPRDVVERVIENLERPGVYANPSLAARMRRVHGL